MSKPLPNGTANFAISGEEELIQDAMQELDISRESASIFVGKTYEHMLKFPTASDADVMEAWMKDLYAAVADSEPWAVEYSKAYLCRVLPRWVAAYDEAVESRHDPATAISLTFGLGINTAAHAVDAVLSHKEGNDISQIVQEIARLSIGTEEDNA